MLRITPIANSAAAKSYYSLADYLIEAEELYAVWHGKAAKMLGLSGKADVKDFNALCDNLHPKTLNKLTKAKGPRRVGYDFTFSVPKTVSVAYAIGGDKRIVAAFQQAVADTMNDVEADMQTRVRKFRQESIRSSPNIVWADFVHKTSRPVDGMPDPQLHCHAVCFSLTHDPAEGEWKAGEFGQIKKDGPYYQSLYMSRLATNLQEIGYQLTDKKGTFELADIPKELIPLFSRRTAQIEKASHDLDITNPEIKAKLGATTREAKRQGQTWEQLLKWWRNRMTPEQLRSVDLAVQSNTPVVVTQKNREAVAYALTHLLKRDSVVEQRAVVLDALNWAIGRSTPDGVMQEITSSKLLSDTIDGRVKLSHPNVLDEEEAIIEFAIKGRGRFHPLNILRNRTVDDDTITLSPSQQAACDHVLQSPDQVMMIRGFAGTGKTTITKRILEQVSVPYVVLAPTADASRGVLRADGIEGADTLATLLKSKEMQAKVAGGLIWLDEASLAGSRDICRLSQLTDKLGARLVIAGDPRQHKSISRGDILTMLEERAGLPVAVVSDIQRQRGEHLAIAEAVARGFGKKAFDAMQSSGWIKKLESYAEPAKAYANLIEQKKKAILICPTLKEGAAITEALRMELRSRGMIGKEEKTRVSLTPVAMTEPEKADTRNYHEGLVIRLTRNGYGQRSGALIPYSEAMNGWLAKNPYGFQVMAKSQIGVSTGDRLRITANHTSKDGHILNNGAIYTVAGFNGDDIRLDNGWVIAGNDPLIAYGHVLTSHKAQGKTVDYAVVVLPDRSLDLVNMPEFYVDVTRARYGVIVFAESPDKVRDRVENEDKRMLASDLVAMQRKRRRDRARQYVDMLRQVPARAINKLREITRNQWEIG